MATAKAVIECPDGKEYLSGGKIEDQQCGSISQGRFRWLACLRLRKIKIPATAANVAAPIAAKRWGPPKKARIKPSVYQSQPAPPRVATIIRMRNHRGARQRCTRRISLWSFD